MSAVAVSWADMRRFVRWYVGCTCLFLLLAIPYLFFPFHISALVLIVVYALVLAQFWWVRRRGLVLSWRMTVVWCGLFASACYLVVAALREIQGEPSNSYLYGGGEILIQDGVLTSAGRWLIFVEGSVWVFILGVIASGVGWIAVFGWSRQIGFQHDQARP